MKSYKRTSSKYTAKTTITSPQILCFSWTCPVAEAIVSFARPVFCPNMRRKDKITTNTIMSLTDDQVCTATQSNNNRFTNIRSMRSSAR